MRSLRCFTVLSAAAACAVLPGAALGAKGGVTVYAHAVTGVATRAGDQSASVASGWAVHSHGARSRPRTASATAPATAVPRAASSGLKATTSPLIANFNGTSSRDSAATNFDAEFEPPDQGLCVGNGFVVDMVNSAYTVYRPNGAVVTGPFNINRPFSEGLTQFTSDPRCYYDASDQYVVRDDPVHQRRRLRSVGRHVHLDIAVNNPGDPTTPWTVYQIDTTDPSGNGCPCFGDQPRLGIDSQNLYVTERRVLDQRPPVRWHRDLRVLQEGPGRTQPDRALRALPAPEHRGHRCRRRRSPRSPPAPLRPSISSSRSILTAPPISGSACGR